MAELVKRTAGAARRTVTVARELAAGVVALGPAAAAASTTTGAATELELAANGSANGSDAATAGAAATVAAAELAAGVARATGTGVPCHCRTSLANLGTGVPRRCRTRFIDRDDLIIGSSPARRFVQLDRVSVGVLELDLAAAGAGLDLVAEPHPGPAQRGDHRLQIVDVQHDPVPAARLLAASVGHRT
jgi:hypothetical protein